jgi:DNA-binding LytR/AlgR family response regulator
VLLRGTLADEQLQLPPQAVLALVAADNYVEVHYERAGAPARALLRQSLAALEAQLAPWPRFMRVHRSYVVNLTRVTAATGNAQGYRLQVAGLAQAVPVARAYTAALRQRLQAPAP